MLDQDMVPVASSSPASFTSPAYFPANSSGPLASSCDVAKEAEELAGEPNPSRAEFSTSDRLPNLELSFRHGVSVLSGTGEGECDDGPQYFTSNRDAAILRSLS